MNKLEKLTIFLLVAFNGTSQSVDNLKGFVSHKQAIVLSTTATNSRGDLYSTIGYKRYFYGQNNRDFFALKAGIGNISIRPLQKKEAMFLVDLKGYYEFLLSNSIALASAIELNALTYNSSTNPGTELNLILRGGVDIFMHKSKQICLTPTVGYGFTKRLLENQNYFSDRRTINIALELGIRF